MHSIHVTQSSPTELYSYNVAKVPQLVLYDVKGHVCLCLYLFSYHNSCSSLTIIDWPYSVVWLRCIVLIVLHQLWNHRVGSCNKRSTLTSLACHMWSHTVIWCNWNAIVVVQYPNPSDDKLWCSVTHETYLDGHLSEQSEPGGFPDVLQIRQRSMAFRDITEHW